jgi:hypothetical protein
MPVCIKNSKNNQKEIIIKPYQTLWSMACINDLRKGIVFTVQMFPCGSIERIIS